VRFRRAAAQAALDHLFVLQQADGRWASARTLHATEWALVAAVLGQHAGLEIDRPAVDRALKVVEEDLVQWARTPTSEGATKDGWAAPFAALSLWDVSFLDSGIGGLLRSLLPRLTDAVPLHGSIEQPVSLETPFWTTLGLAQLGGSTLMRWEARFPREFFTGLAGTPASWQTDRLQGLFDTPTDALALAVLVECVYYRTDTGLLGDG